MTMIIVLQKKYEKESDFDVDGSFRWLDCNLLNTMTEHFEMVGLYSIETKDQHTLL
jgi:hypothetical protein